MSQTLYIIHGNICFYLFPSAAVCSGAKILLMYLSCREITNIFQQVLYLFYFRSSNTKMAFTGRNVWEKFFTSLTGHFNMANLPDVIPDRLFLEAIFCMRNHTSPMVIYSVLLKFFTSYLTLTSNLSAECERKHSSLSSRRQFLCFQLVRVCSNLLHLTGKALFLLLPFERVRVLILTLPPTSVARINDQSRFFSGSHLLNKSYIRLYGLALLDLHVHHA